MIRSSNSMSGMALGDLPGDLQEEAVGVLHDVGLVRGRDLLAPVLLGVLEGGLDDPLRAEHRDRLDRDAGVVANGAVELVGQELRAASPSSSEPCSNSMPGVEVLGVLAHDHDVGLGKVGAHALVGLAGADARVEVELLAQRHVDRAVAGADRGGRGALDGDAALADRVERAVGQRVALLLVDVDARVLEVPVELDAGGLEHPLGGLGELGPGAVARDEGDAMCQVSPFSP